MNNHSMVARNTEDLTFTGECSGMAIWPAPCMCICIFQFMAGTIK